MELFLINHVTGPLICVQKQMYEAFLQSELVLSAFDGSPLAALTVLYHYPHIFVFVISYTVHI